MGPVFRMSLALVLILVVSTASGERTSSRVVDHPVGFSRAARPIASSAGSSGADSVIHLKQWQSVYGGNDHWFGVLAIAYNWEQAEALSHTLVLDTMSGYLATIQTGAENDFIIDSVLAGLNPPTVQDQFYLGGKKVNGAWTWLTGETFCYANWAPGEPNYFDETVLSMWGPFQSPDPAIAGTWNNTLSNDLQNPAARFWAVVEWGHPHGASAPVCGNGVIECGEECDDGNLVSNDGCNSSCDLEVCGDGVVQPWEECDDGNLIAGDGCDPVCSLQVCGNGEREPGEQCDDGNVLTNDGCNANCLVERCGDGVRQPWEECDDGNLVAGDGCDPLCLVEACGNGRLDAGECCDDSNLVDGDGCSSGCLDEAMVCGNGVLECIEDCDDGNLTDGDGCQSDCQYTCVPGDLDGSQTPTAGDIIHLCNCVFKGPCAGMNPCWLAGDINCSMTITSADIIHLINYIFKGMAVPECVRCPQCA